MNRYSNSSTSRSRVYTWPKYYGWFVVALAACFYCYEYFLRISPSVMSDQLRQAFHLDGAGFGNLADFYYYIYTPLQFFVGILMDRFGPRKLLSLACLSCALGAFLFSASHVFALAALGRFLIGFGSAFAFVGALKIATIWLPKNRFAMVSGGITALGMVGAMIGDVGLTALVAHQGWRGTMVDAAVAGLCLAVVLFIFIHDKGDEHKRSMTEKMEATFPYLLRGLLHALRKPRMWLYGIIGTTLYMSLTVFAELWSIPYYHVVERISPIHAASLNTAVFLGWAVGGPILGFLSDRIRSRQKVLLISSVFAFFVSVYLFVFHPYLSYTAMYTTLFIFGLSTSAQVLVFAAGKELNSEKMAGTSIALINGFVMIGGLVFQPLIGWILDLEWHGKMAHGLRVFSAHDYEHAMLVIPVCMLISVACCLFLKRDRI